MVRWAVLACLVLGAWCSPLLPESGVSLEFQEWAKLHEKTYATESSLQKAFETYIANERVIAFLNANPDDTAEYGHTRFSDLTQEEFTHQYLQHMKMDASGFNFPRESAPKTDLESFDWRDRHAVSAVKDQGPCGSCWAFSAVQSVESAVYLASGSNSTEGPTPLSVEQVVECDAHDYACYGGWPYNAYRYIIEQGGLAAETDYPYDVAGKVICLANQTFNETCGDGICDDPPLTGHCDLSCSATQHPFVAQISSWKALTEDEDGIKGFVATSGPVSVAIDASGTFGVIASWLQFYKKGVANPRCSTTDLDHAVFIVGFGVDSNKDYWTVKNSWGSKWGEDGYFRLLRGKGKCGINTQVTTAVV